MATRKKQEIFQTMKISPKDDDENAISFEDCQITLIDFADIETKFGLKTVATVEKDGDKYNVFLNQTSLNNLIEAFGEDDALWLNKVCDLKKEIDGKYKNEMIVFYPVAYLNQKD